VANVTSRVQPEIEKLARERKEALEELEHLQTDLRNLAEPTADDADIDGYEREKLWALVQTVQRKLESIDRAIELAQNGSYGICQTCGDRIDPARLEILPTASLCLKCQRQFELKNRRRRR
jgi:RNA polymerase-binding protein DksA